MSPEQLDSARDVDARTDVWALGVVLYELIAGRTPFNGESIPQLVTSVLHDRPPPLGALQVEAPLALDAVLLKAMSKQRKQRYASVSELVNALMQFAPPASAGTAGRVSRLLSMPDPVPPATPRPDRARDSPGRRARDPLPAEQALRFGGGSEHSAVVVGRSAPAQRARTLGRRPAALGPGAVDRRLLHAARRPPPGSRCGRDPGRSSRG
jgi:serine/threonine-protein kinase